jgi:hypothetical protein
MIKGFEESIGMPLFKILNKSVCLTVLVWLFGGNLNIDSAVFAFHPIKAITSQGVETEKGVETEITPEEIKKKRKELENRVHVSEQPENQETAMRLGISIETQAERTERLKFIQSVYQRALTALKEQTDLEKELYIAQEKFTKNQKSGVVEKPPYNVSFYDNIIGQLVAAEQSVQTNKLEIEMTKKVLETIRSRLDNARTKWRILKEEIQDKPEESTTEKNVWTLENSRIEIDLPEALQTHQKIEYQNRKIKLEIAELQLKFFQQKMVESELRFRIDKLFQEAVIVIAFSQQDIHLDTHKPLELRMIEDGREIQPGS